jgi:mannose-6-phosphate isomerase class I
MRHVLFEETVPLILGSHAEVSKELQFATPVPEFELYQYRLENNNVSLSANSAEILLALAGDLEVTSPEGKLRLEKGDAAFITSGTNYEVNSSLTAKFFRAAVPVR